MKLLESLRLFRSNSVLVRTFLAFTGLFLGLVLLVNVFVWRVLSDNYRERDSMTNLNALSRVSDSLDSYMQYLAGDMFGAMWQNDIIAMMIAPSHRNYERDYAVTSFLERTQTMSVLVDECSLYLPQPDLVYTPAKVTAYSEQNSGAYAALEAYSTRPDSFKTFHITQRTRAKLYCEDGAIHIAHEFSMNRTLGILFFTINADELYKVIQGDRRFSQDEVLIYSENGEAVFEKVIAHEYVLLEDLKANAELISTGGVKPAGRAYYMTQSRMLGWIFLYPASGIREMDMLSGVFAVLIPVMLFCLLAYLLLGSYAVYSLFKPVNRLMNYIMQQSGSNAVQAKDEYEFFQQQYALTLERSQSLEKQFENIAPQVVRELIFQLASGTHLSEAYIEETLESAQSGFGPHGRFVEFVAALRSPSGRPLPAAELTELMKQVHIQLSRIPLTEGRMISVQMEESLFLLVFAFSQESQVSRIKRAMLDYQMELKNRVGRLPCRLETGIGAVHTNLRHLRCEYEAILVRLREPKNGHADLEGNGLDFYRDRAQRILKMAAESRENAMDMAELLCDEAAERSGSPGVSAQALEMLIDCIFEQLVAMRIPPRDLPLAEYQLTKEPTESVHDMKCKAMSLCAQAIGYVHLAGKKNSFKYLEAAKVYIDKHYEDSALDLGRVAEYVGINVSYLSKLLKEMEGQTFVEYLSACRVEHAKQMLEQDKHSVKEIGDMCGFNSPQNFIRVFKKYTGNTPGAFREHYRQE